MITCEEKEALAVCTGANYRMDRKYAYALNFIYLSSDVISKEYDLKFQGLLLQKPLFC